MGLLYLLCIAHYTLCITGEWNLAWSDDSEEMSKYQTELDKCFNADLREAEKMELTNTADGTFLMSFMEWRARYTSLFAAVNFPLATNLDAALNTTALTTKSSEPN